MNVPAPVTIQIDERTHLLVWRMIFLRSIPRCLLPIAVGLFIVLLPILATDGWNIGLLYALAGGVVAGVLMVFIQWLTLARRARKIYRESAQLSLPKVFGPDSDGFTFEWSAGHTRSLWNEMAKWDETDDLFAIFPNRLVAYTIPKAQVDPTMVNFIRQQLQASGLHVRGKLRK